MLRRIYVNGKLYMLRWYLWGFPRMPDGSWPFEPSGKTKASAKRARFSVMLHKILRSDPDRGLHNHPWCWAFALILWGGYIEHRAEGYGQPLVRRRVRPGQLVRLTPDVFHRIELIDDRPSWSLFFAGPIFKHWGFVDSNWQFRKA